MRILVSGGGTAGHVYPILATLEELEKSDRGLEVLYVGSKNGIEKEITARKGIEFKPISCGKFRRYFSFDNFIDPFRVILGVIQSYLVITKFKPDIVFAKGGYVSLPVGIASFFKRPPLVIHESDAKMGLANRVLARIARRVAVGFPVGLYPKIDKDKIVFSGNPIRSDFLKTKSDFSKNNFKLKEDLPMILVMGGSQGAHKINQCIFEIASVLVKSFQIIHISGTGDYNLALQKKKELPIDIQDRYFVYDFIEEGLVSLLEASSIVITRAGAGALAEIAYTGRPIVIVPLEGHQEKNAKYFSKKNAGIVIKNTLLDSKILSEKIREISNDDRISKKLAENIKKLAVEDAAARLAKVILGEANHNGK